MNRYADSCFTRLRKVLVCYLAMYAMVVLWRILFILGYVPQGTFPENTADIPLMLWNGFRFDMMALCYMNAIPVLLALLPDSKALRQVLRWYYVVFFTLLASLLVLDYYYFRNFDDHLNVVLFTFFDEEPWSLVQTMWQEYPVIWVALGMILLIWAVVKIMGNVWLRQDCRHACHLQERIVSTKWWPATFVVVLGLLFLGMRGSLDSFPLQAEDLRVSASRDINNCVPNPMYMLKKAIKEKGKEFALMTVQESLSEDGYKSIEEAAAAALWAQKDDASLPERERLEHLLFAHADSLPYKAPNVVVIFSESWSEYLSEMDGPGCELLDGLGKHLQQDYWFKNIQSVRNGTINTIEGFIPQSPYKRIFQTKYRFVNHTTSVLNAYRENGYFTAFVSGMEQGWENCGDGLLHQGMDAVISKYELLERHPEYEYSIIGVYDRYMLEGLFELLSDSTFGGGRPKFMFAMTTTNHPPFDLEPGFSPVPLDEEVFNDKCFMVDKPVLERYLYGAQYANRQIGMFMDSIKASALAENTIVIVTGDHNVRAILDTQGGLPAEYRYRVPVYMYLPPYIKERFQNIDTERLGDHYDLIPTLAQLSLSDVDYIEMGHSLLDSEGKGFCYNEMQTLPEGSEGERVMHARESLLRAYFQWLWSHAS